MGFASGTISFRRFSVIGEAPSAPQQSLLDRLGEFQLQEGGYGLPDEIEYGWSGGRHLYDAQFTFENNVFADALLFALRIDSNKVPGDVKKAYQALEEQATARNNPSGFISKAQKADVKDSVRRRMDEDLKAGKFRRSKLVPILWDLPTQTLYTSASAAAAEKLMELFERSFELKLQPESAGTLAQRLLEGKHRDYEDLKPTRFASGPDGEHQSAEYPWVLKGVQPKDFLGNEFLLWLWHEAEHSGEALGNVSVLVDKFLDLDCAFGQTGRDLLRGTGPGRMPEARDGLRSGKVPRKMGLVLEAGGSFQLTLAAESMALAGLRLPEVEEAENPRVLFEERIALIHQACQTVDGLYSAFLKQRVSGKWESAASTIRRWIATAGRKVAAA